LGSRIALLEAGKLVTVLAPHDFLKSANPLAAAYVKAFRAGWNSANNDSANNDLANNGGSR
jgi:ABC-type proline/glycine betaine transport system ATPase subunit